MKHIKFLALGVSILVALSLTVSILSKAKKVEAPTLAVEKPTIQEIATATKVVAKPYRRIDPVPLVEKIEIAQKIASVFPEHKEVMVAIALSESGLNKNATGYNCYYKVVTKETGEYDKIVGKYLDFNSVSKTKLEGYRSTYCRTKDIKNAWSKDGGVFQINNPKPEDYNVDVNLSKARAKYDGKGLSSWTVYNTGEYKKFLPKAKELLALK